jgi:hypothetical protein
MEKMIIRQTPAAIPATAGIAALSERGTVNDTLRNIMKFYPNEYCGNPELFHNHYLWYYVV